MPLYVEVLLTCIEVASEAVLEAARTYRMHGLGCRMRNLWGCCAYAVECALGGGGGGGWWWLHMHMGWGGVRMARWKWTLLARLGRGEGEGAERGLPKVYA